MNKRQHKRIAAASMLQNGIFQNTKCAVRDGFQETVTYSDFYFICSRVQFKLYIRVRVHMCACMFTACTTSNLLCTHTIALNVNMHTIAICCPAYQFLYML